METFHKIASHTTDKGKISILMRKMEMKSDLRKIAGICIVFATAYVLNYSYFLLLVAQVLEVHHTKIHFLLFLDYIYTI